MARFARALGLALVLALVCCIVLGSKLVDLTSYIMNMEQQLQHTAASSHTAAVADPASRGKMDTAVGHDHAERQSEPSIGHSCPDVCRLCISGGSADGGTPSSYKRPCTDWCSRSGFCGTGTGYKHRGTICGRPCAATPGGFDTRLPDATMRTCFDSDRCRRDRQPLIFNMFGKVAGGHGTPQALSTDDPARACIFLSHIYVPTTLERRAKMLEQLIKLTEHQLWNGTGRNHVIQIHEDRPFYASLFGGALDEEVRGRLGCAMLWGSNLDPLRARVGFDVHTILPPSSTKVLSQSLAMQAIPADERRWLATFKGKMYGEITGITAFKRETMLSLGAHPRVKVVRSNDVAAKGAKVDPTEWVDMLNSTFMFAPGGFEPGSYRFLEAIAAGAIPVLLQSERVAMPYHDIIPWQDCTVQFSEEDAPHIVAWMAHNTASELRARQHACTTIYKRFLSGPTLITRLAFAALLHHAHMYRESTDVLNAVNK
jgi:hypothetical protein